MNFRPKPKDNTATRLPILFKHGASQQETDYAIWEAFKSGNKIAFDYIFESNIKMLYTYGNGIIRDRELVADCIQELFIELWNKREILGSTNSIKFYLFKSLRRRIIRKNETEQRRSDVDLTLTYQDSFNLPFESELILDEVRQKRKQHLSLALSIITQRQREAILLRYYKKLTFEEMSSRMKMDIPSVRNILSKAIQSLRLQMGDQIKNIFNIIICIALYKSF